MQAEIDAAKARRAGYRAQAADTVARGGPTRATDEELGIIKTDDTVGKIAADASEGIGSRLSRVMSRFRRGGKKRMTSAGKSGGRPDSNRRRGDHDPDARRYTTATAGTAGLEPTTSRLTSERSGPLSYAPIEVARVGFEPTVSSS